MLLYRDGLEQEIDAPPKVYKTAAGHVVEEYQISGEVKYFVTLAGTPYCAHGATLADAIADALWKDESKRPSIESLRNEINDAGPERKISLQEFRVLTGACLEGSREALKQKGLDGSPMFLKDVVKFFPDWGRKLSEVLRGRD